MLKKTLRHKPPTIPLHYFIATETTLGQSDGWTLPRILGEMLELAEEMFGARNSDYTMLGIEFSSLGGCICNVNDSRYVFIQLGTSALYDNDDACRQLAHECIHLLSPTGKKDANVLEEGLAMYFELYYMHKVFGPGWWDYPTTFDNYCYALSRTQQLLDIQPDAIKLLRAYEPTIAYISADLITRTCPAVPKDLADSLAKPFY